MSLKIYDADQVNISLAGIPITGGYADGEFLTIERESPAFEDVVGTDGEVTRSKTRDGRATITIRLMQTSDSNDVLSAFHNADKLAPNGAGVGAFFCEDGNGRALYEAAEAWIQTSPSASFDRAATSREWVFRVADLQDFTGGN